MAKLVLFSQRGKAQVMLSGGTGVAKGTVNGAQTLSFALTRTGLTPAQRSARAPQFPWRNPSAPGASSRTCTTANLSA